MAPGRQRKLHAYSPPLAAHKLLGWIFYLIRYSILSGKVSIRYDTIPIPVEKGV